MQSHTREEMIKLRMYTTVADKNDADIDAQKNNDVSCECAISLWTYKRRMMQLQMHKRRMMQVVMYDAVADVQEENVKEQVAEGSCKY